MSLRRRNNTPIYFTVAVILCLTVLIGVIIYPDIKAKLSKSSSDTESFSGAQAGKDELSGNESEMHTASLIDCEIRTDETDSISSVTDIENGDLTTDTVENTKSPSHKEPPAPKEIDGDMSDVLFIGDSRTIGIRDYSDIIEADYFATTGMSVFNVHNESVDVGGRGKISFEDLLARVSYRKIFIMLGINELGYNMDAVFTKYKALVEEVQAAQPDAKIYIEANLHVVKEKSETSDIYNNEKIDKLNSMISTLADSSSVFYIDVNSLFDDEQGNLSDKYACDGSHLVGTYYKTWGDWIRGQ